MKKIIFTQRVEVVASYNERRDCADQRICSFLSACGYLPIPVPNNDNLIPFFIKQIVPDGIVLTGGNSLVKYGGEAPERDSVDSKLISLAIAEHIPIYGFCRGMQVILDYFGETLTDIHNHVAVKHKLFGKDGFNRVVNSYHNQACLSIVNPSLKILAETEDGVIEAIKHSEYAILATMWHPERESPFDEADVNLIKQLFK